MGYSVMLKKETWSMIASVLTGGGLLVAIFSPGIAVGFLGGCALWLTTVTTSLLTKRWSDQTRKKKSAHQQDASKQPSAVAIACDAASDLVLIDMVDGSLGLTLAFTSVAIATAPVAAPVYAVYQRLKAQPQIGQK